MDRYFTKLASRSSYASTSLRFENSLTTLDDTQQ